MSARGLGLVDLNFRFGLRRMTRLALGPGHPVPPIDDLKFGVALWPIRAHRTTRCGLPPGPALDTPPKLRRSRLLMGRRRCVTRRRMVSERHAPANSVEIHGGIVVRGPCVLRNASRSRHLCIVMASLLTEPRPAGGRLLAAIETASATAAPVVSKNTKAFMTCCEKSCCENCFDQAISCSKAPCVGCGNSRSHSFLTAA